MQKTQRASILIWALFFSLFIVFAFVTISSKVHTAITQSGALGKKIDSLLALPANLYRYSDEIQIPGGLLLQKDVSNTFGLKSREKSEIRFSDTLRSSILLQVEEGNPIFYKFLLFNPSTLSGSIVQSGIVTDSLRFFVDFTTNESEGILYIENLGGYSEFSYLTTSKTLNPYTDFGVFQKIGGKYSLKRKTRTHNFHLGDYSGIDYAKYEMNF